MYIQVLICGHRFLEVLLYALDADRPVFPHPGSGPANTSHQALVLVYGTCVHIYNSWRIKKIGAAEKLKKAEEEATIGTKDLNLIPFGSRALESGIEIEGIWVSRTNTPLPSPIPAATPETTRPGTPSNIDLGAAALPSPRGGGSALGRRQDESLLTTNGLKAAVARGLDKNSSSDTSSTRISYESSLSSPPNGAEGEGTEQTEIPTLFDSFDAAMHAARARSHLTASMMITNDRFDSSGVFLAYESPTILLRKTSPFTFSLPAALHQPSL
ncbi:hypothetical protein TRV_03926 [Trichophyton verrucosum HKI 0517]|uniref:Uncharacterized protein n=1 Tax=Trichophyton verrucosum (strain HKI 0517) TaxID=663202 RepID=D4D9Y3_TRIVH|nr:uncharacterized protein TRV_03926 [Trichophyton verrucosum HKI 0517]EFE41360.1 hypothetical protein TRV_03926 [Trichophyton verrucosum HKI 0517]